MARGPIFRLIFGISCAILQAAPGSKAPGEASRSLAAHAPILQLETGFHTAPIRQAALSADGATLVTAAEDKTLRVWDAEPLRLRRVIRPPQGSGPTGKLYAVALAPDGALAVVSGYTGARSSGRHSLYLVDVRSGRLVREIDGLPQVVNHLSISPDGQRVVAHLGGTSGLRVFRIADGSEVGRAVNYGGPTYGGAFSPEGNYLATSDDGFLRLYGPDFKLLSQVKAPAPGPFRVAYRPDGREVALGYADGCRVDLLSAKTLFPAARPDCKGAAGPLAIVAWSRDGQRLFASGGVDFGTARNEVRCWGQAGRGEFRTVPVAWATVGELLPTREGGLLVAAQDPALIRLDSDFKVQEQLQAQPGDLNQVGEALKVDASGGRVSLGWRFPGQKGRAFSAVALEFREAEADLAAPRTASPDLDLRDWRNGEKPMLSGKVLAGLEPHEIVRSLSVTRDGQAFVLGTDWTLRAYQKSGRPEAWAPLPAAAWGLNHTADGRHLVAALADGTVRWYRLPALEEVAALFLHSDAQRWVMWTPKGYYASSVGGEELLGWLVQRSGEAGEFFPCQKFRDTYLKPSLLAGTFGTAQTTAAPSLARPTMPPLLRVISPLDRAAFSGGSQEFQLSVRTYGARDAVQRVHLYLDGAKLPVVANPLPGAWVESDLSYDTLYTLKIPLALKQDCRVGIAVETAQGTSRLAEVNLQYLVPAQVGTRPPVPATPLTGVAPLAVSPAAPAAVHAAPAPTPAAPVAAAPVVLAGPVTVPVATPVEAPVAAPAQVPVAAAPTPAAPTTTVAPLAPVAASPLATPTPTPLPAAPAAVSVAPAALAGPSLHPGKVPTVQGPVTEVVLETPRAPRLNLVAIGVADYQEPALSLRFPAKDATDVANVFSGASSKLYSQVDRRLVLNSQATREGVLAALRALKERARPEDVSVIFISGHGATTSTSSTYYFIPYDYKKGDFTALLDGRDIQKILTDTQGKVVMLMDTCHSGNVMGEGRLRGLEDIIRLTRFINDLTSAESGVTVFSSSTGSQVSLESTAWNNGAFTKALVEALSGKADAKGTGRVTLGMLDAYLRARVAELTRGRQTPVSGKPDSRVDYPLALSR